MKTNSGTPPQGGATPLDGLIAVELGTRIAAGTCGTLLAQLGATVIAPEPRTTSRIGKWADRASAMAGKLSISLNESDPTDRAVIEKLIRVADIVILSTDVPGEFRTSAGLAQWQAQPGQKQIVCDLTAFGHQGPMQGQAASDRAVQALGGVMSVTGRGDGPPMCVGVPLLEISAGIYGTTSVLAAARLLRLEGTGQHVEATLYEAAVNSLSSFLTLHYGGEPATRAGNGHALAAPWGVYASNNGFVAICTVTTDQFVRLAEVMGKPELARDPRFATPAARREHTDLLDSLISEWTVSRSTAECEAILAPANIACGPIISVPGLATEKNLAHRGMFVQTIDPISGKPCALPSSPLRTEPPVAATRSQIPAPDDNRLDVLRHIEQRTTGCAVAPSSDAQGLHAQPSLRPLTGLRVVEVGQYTLAPFAGRQLSSLGAEVIKVEPPKGDAIRHAKVGKSQTSQIFAMMNTDKRGLVLDLTKPASQDTLNQLLSDADVLLENMRPGALASYGFPSERLRKDFPNLIYCGLSGFGAESAYPGRAAFDTVVQAMSGLMSTTTEQGIPYKAGISVSDLVGSQCGLLAILASIEARARGVSGIHCDVAMQDATTWLTSLYVAENTQQTAYCVVECLDGYALIEGELEAITKVAARWPVKRDDLPNTVNVPGLSISPVLTVGEVVEHPQTVAQHILVERFTAEGDTYMVLDSPLRLHTTPPRVERLMSDLGVDDAAVLADLKISRQ